MLIFTYIGALNLASTCPHISTGYFFIGNGSCFAVFLQMANLQAKNESAKPSHNRPRQSPEPDSPEMLGAEDANDDML